MRKNKILIIVLIIILFVLNLIKSIYVFNFKYKTSDTYSKMRCMVIQKEKIEKDKISYLVEYNSNKFILNIYSDSYADESEKIDINEFANFRYGDVLEFRGKITIPEKLNNPFEFDYKKYLNSNNIVATIITYKVENVDKVTGNIFVKFGNIIRENIDRVIDNKMPKEEASLFKSMLYGNDLDLSDDIKEGFNKNGISHMLAVSGMHLMYILKILNFVTKDMNKKFSNFLNLSVIFLFCVISSMSVSVIRASIMAGIGIICSNKKECKNEVEDDKNKKEYNNSSVYMKLLIAFFAIVIYNPYSIFNISFQMSFLATLGIVSYNSLVYSYFTVILKISRRYKYIIEILSLSISANILILPLQIYYFGKFELISFLSNILFSPVISFEFLLGFISIFLGFIPFISDILITSNIIILKIIISLTNLIQKINFFTIYIPKLNYLELFLIYSTIFLQTTKKYIPVIFKNKYRKIVRKTILFVTSFTFLYSISMYVYRMYFEEYIYFFNVGQGNMAIIREDRKVVVIDIGSTSKNLASNVLKSFLEAKAIYSIDSIVISHMHEDHVNGIYEIAEEFNIKSVVYSVPKTTEKGEYEKFDKLVSKKGIAKVEVNKDDEIKIGDITIQVLMPVDNKVIVSNDMLNSNSAVYLLEKDNKYYLFMGDATKEAEEELFKNLTQTTKEKLNNLTAIQIGHHGSKTSSSEEFIQKLNPCIAIISSKKEKYGHPHKITLDTLEKYNFEIKITEEVGVVKIK